MPYVTASIILQLLTVVVPKLGAAAEGGRGRATRKINQYTRYLTVALAAAQAAGYCVPLPARRARSTRNTGRLVLIVDHAHRRHDAADVDGRADHEARDRQRHLAADLRLDPHRRAAGDQRAWINGGPIEKLFFPLVAHRRSSSRSSSSRRASARIPIQYAKRMVGRRQTAGGSTYMPLRVNMAGVIPVIFAAAIMAFPPTIGQFFPSTQSLINAHFSPLELDLPRSSRRVLIIVFTYFYTAVQFNPVDQADNLRKYGGYIPGIRPGPADGAVPRPRADAADAARLALPGARSPCCRRSSSTYVGFSQATSRALGGTSVLIVVGVALDTMRQMESQMMMRYLRGLPDVVNLLVLGPAGRREGHAGEADLGGLRDPAHRDRRHVPRRDRGADASSAGASSRSRRAASSSPTS